MLSVTGKIVSRLFAVGFTTEMLPVKQGSLFIYATDFCVFTVALASAPFISY